MNGLLLLWVIPTLAQAPCLGLAALAPGSSWTYAGTRLWSTPGSRADSGSVQWTMTLLQNDTIPDGHVLLIRGFIAELAWSDPSTQPRLSALVCRHHRLSHLAFPTDSAAIWAVRHWADSLLNAATLFYQEPVHPGMVFGQDPPRPDELYGWLVEDVPSGAPLPQSCRTASARALRLSLRTLPDHQVVDWLDGVGITAYLYGHHGTPAGADVHLVRCDLRS